MTSTKQTSLSDECGRGLTAKFRKGGAPVLIESISRGRGNFIFEVFLSALPTLLSAQLYFSSLYSNEKIIILLYENRQRIQKSPERVARS